ncbi:MAG: hypothetical protein QGD88_04150 [Anaerolineae bacterium]|nr:hypothetical protein [Anaerolineae bacterium]
MRFNDYRWIWLLTLILGFGLGLTYAWEISPVQYVDAEPHSLRDDFKDHFRSVVAAAYFSNQDLDRARARLSLIRDPDPSQALSAQAQRMLAGGESPELVNQIAVLASAFQGQEIGQPLPTVIENDGNSSIPTVISSTVVVNSTSPTTELEMTITPVPIFTPTPRPTRTPTPTLGAPYQLVGQDTFCETILADGLLQIFVTNSSRKPIPGAEIIITWDGGEEHFFTGLKPELGHGYADFLMTEAENYTVRMADGGTAATDVFADTCTDTAGNTYLGGQRISFQQP